MCNAMKTQFSFSRALDYLCSLKYFNLRGLLIVSLLMLIVQGVVIFCQYLISDEQSKIENISTGLVFAMLAVTVDFIFSDYKKKQTSQNAILLPANQLEKFVSLVTVSLLLGLYLMLLADLASLAVLYFYFEIPFEQTDIFSNSDGAFGMVSLFFLYLAFHSMIVWTALSSKTMRVLSVVVVVLAMLFIFIIPLMVIVNIVVVPQEVAINSIYFQLALLLVAVMFYRKGFRRFKNIELHIQ